MGKKTLPLFQYYPMIALAFSQPHTFVSYTINSCQPDKIPHILQSTVQTVKSLTKFCFWNMLAWHAVPRISTLTVTLFHTCLHYKLLSGKNYTFQSDWPSAGSQETMEDYSALKRITQHEKAQHEVTLNAYYCYKCFLSWKKPIWNTYCKHMAPSKWHSGKGETVKK